MVYMAHLAQEFVSREELVYKDSSSVLTFFQSSNTPSMSSGVI
jgi:hypothetical protein